MGYDTFHRSECPHLALSAKIASDGDTDGWHFDSNDVVFSILLQAPTGGGDFEYTPFVRSDGAENFEAVAAITQNPDGQVLRPAMQPGDLTVFFGDESLHRVSPVTGDQDHIVALFCYDRDPGTTFSETYVRGLNGRLPTAN